MTFFSIRRPQRPQGKGSPLVRGNILAEAGICKVDIRQFMPRRKWKKILHFLWTFPVDFDISLKTEGYKVCHQWNCQYSKTHKYVTSHYNARSQLRGQSVSLLPGSPLLAHQSFYLNHLDPELVDPLALTADSLFCKLYASDRDKIAPKYKSHWLECPGGTSKKLFYGQAGPYGMVTHLPRSEMIKHMARCDGTRM